MFHIVYTKSSRSGYWTPSVICLAKSQADSTALELRLQSHQRFGLYQYDAKVLSFEKLEDAPRSLSERKMKERTNE